MDQEHSDVAPATRRGRRRRPAHSVSVGGRSLPIVTLGPSGFVLAAEHALRLPGFVDIMAGNELLDRRLVICAWQRDGLVGYEYKSAPVRRPPAVDYVLPADDDAEPA